jgi:hypothetical protein
MTFWFYIRSLATNGVVSCSKECHEFLRSQVIVEPFDESDSQLWCWDGQFLRNKHTDLVLDIRKGKDPKKKNHAFAVLNSKLVCFLF